MRLSAIKYYSVAITALLPLGMIATLQLAQPNTIPIQGCQYQFPSYNQAFELTDEAEAALPAEEKNMPRFELSQCYPQQLPAEQPPWIVDGRALKFWSEAEARDYQIAILKYAYANNLAVNWVVQRNQPVKWFHAPWLHFGGTGREPLHGLTYELASSPGTLAEKQERYVQNWAVSVYNARGGYVLGQVWKGVRHPHPTTLPHAEAAVFPNGTVAIKLLFTQATVEEVPYLEGQAGYEWAAYIYEKLPTDPRRPNSGAGRSVERLRLLQVDVAVRDDRSPTGWVFGTFVYNGHLPTSPYTWCEPKASPWCKVVPVGLMWGNDPGLTAEKAAAGNPPIESIFTDAGALPAELLKVRKGRVGFGRDGRLNGPVDDRKSSCLSCHATASWPQFERVPPDGLAEEKKLHWFRNFNVKVGDAKQSFWPGTEALDYSLQLSSGLRNFNTCRTAIPAEPDCAPPPGPSPGPAGTPVGRNTSGPQAFRAPDN